MDIPYAFITVTFLASTLAFAFPLASLEGNLVETVALDTAFALEIAALGGIGFAFLFLLAFSVTFLFFDSSSALLLSHLSCWPFLGWSSLTLSHFILPKDLLLS